MAATSYSKYSFDDLLKLNISIEKGSFMPQFEEILPSNLLSETLQFNMQVPMDTEIAKMQLIVSPIMNELLRITNNGFTYFSGYQFDVEKELGLKGHCDYLLTLKPKAVFIESPVICVVEAKRDNIEDAIPQCIAEMYAASIFNQKKGNDIKFTHGIITSGNDWQILRLENNVVTINEAKFYLNILSQLLGALKAVINFYKA